MAWAALWQWLSPPGGSKASASQTPPSSCPICGGILHLLDCLDLNRACEDMKGKVLPACGIPIAYYLCEDCGHCHAPEMAGWSKQRFAEAVYNLDYARVDPDYVQVRPLANATLIAALLDQAGVSLSHLDYGGGSGLLSARLRELGRQSSTLDPYLDDGDGLPVDAQFDLVTAFEVFEHVPDVSALVADLARYTRAEGVVLFSTLLNDGQVLPGHRLDWWYAAPRNGHITLFSAQSLGRALARGGFTLTSLNAGLHLAWKSRPAWLTPALLAQIKNSW